MLSELDGRGWMMVEPPEDNDADSVVARYNGQPIKAGVLMDILEDTAETMHTIYRTGRYDLELRIDFDIGRGQIRVNRARGYE